MKTDQLQHKLEDALKHTKKQGVDAAEGLITIDSGFSVTARNGEVETLEHHQEKSLQISVYLQQRTATATTSDLSKAGILATVEKACAIAAYTQADPAAGLAPAELLAFHYPDLQLYHHWELTPSDAIHMAIECESIAKQHDKRITQSEGTSVSTYDSFKLYGNTHGFIGSYPRSMQSISCSVIAEENQQMQRSHEYTTARRAEDLEDYILVGKKAAQRTIERLGAKRITTRRCPVIYYAPLARGLLNYFISAISGHNLYRQSSFLLDAIDKPVFPKHISIYQEPHLLGAIGSMPFDSEGVATKTTHYLVDGILKSYVLGSYSARKLNLQTTGNAGGVFNLQITPADMNLQALLHKMGTGLLVTELMGQGVNIVNGEYSRGAAGFWVENGEVKYPVEEITIAGNLKDMFANLIAVGNDTDCRSSIRTGSILLEEMTIGGE